MLSTSWHDHEVPSLDILIFARDGGFGCSRGEAQYLINEMDLRKRNSQSLTSSGMGKGTTNFISNVPSWRDGHDEDLGVESGPEDSPEIGRLGGQGPAHVGEVHHFMFGWSGRHLGIFVCTKW